MVSSFAPLSNERKSHLFCVKRNAGLVLGFTPIELLTIIAIFVVLLAIGMPSLQLFQRQSVLEDTAAEIKETLRLAQNRTISSEQAQNYGVFFDNTTAPNQYVLSCDIYDSAKVFDVGGDINVEVWKRYLARNEYQLL